MMRAAAILWCTLILGLCCYGLYVNNSQPTVQERYEALEARLDKIEYLIIMKKPYEKEVK